MSHSSTHSPQDVYKEISIKMAKMSYIMLEDRLTGLVNMFRNKKIDDRKKKDLHELIDKTRQELRTTRRQTVIEDILDEIEAKLDRL